MTYVGRGNDGGCLLACNAATPPRSSPAHIAPLVRAPLRKRRGRTPTPPLWIPAYAGMTYVGRGNDVVVGNDDGVLGVDKCHDALFEVLDGF